VICERPHRWGGYRRVGPGAVFNRRCRRRACPAVDVVTVANEHIIALAAQPMHLPGRSKQSPGLVLSRTRHGQPYLRAVR
jgi:hypothetical protein